KQRTAKPTPAAGYHQLGIAVIGNNLKSCHQRLDIFPWLECSNSQNEIVSNTKRLSRGGGWRAELNWFEDLTSGFRHNKNLFFIDADVLLKVGTDSFSWNNHGVGSTSHERHPEPRTFDAFFLVSLGKNELRQIMNSHYG